MRMIICLKNKDKIAVQYPIDEKKSMAVVDIYVNSF